MDEPGLNRVVRAAYGLLGLQTYFTAGPKEVRAWTVRAGATPQAAGVIHTDFERGFIRAEVASYDDFVSCGGEQGRRRKASSAWKGTTRCATATLSTSGSTYDRSEVRSGESAGPAAPRRASRHAVRIRGRIRRESREAARRIAGDSRRSNEGDRVRCARRPSGRRHGEPALHRERRRVARRRSSKTSSSPRSTANAASARRSSSTSSPRRARKRAAHHVTHRHAERARAGNVPARRIRRLADEADAPQAEEVLGAKILRKVAENGTSSAFSSIMRAHLAMQHRQVVVRHRGVKMVLDVVVHMVREDQPREPRRHDVGACRGQR